MHKQSPALFQSLAVICAYVLIRGWVYHCFPVTSVESWFWRDTLMSAPRLGAFSVLLFLNRHESAVRFDLPARDFGKAALLGFVPVALWAFYFSGGTGAAYTRTMMFIGLFTSLIVGAFEEYAYRGPLLFALRQRLSLFASIAVSSLIFTVYHFQAQSLRMWGAIFLAGVIFANLRFRGLSLGWLALIHGIADAFLFFFPSGNPDPFRFYGLVLHAGLLGYAIVTFPRSHLTERKSGPSVVQTGLEH
jgi:membrane protease YdiL (CAAX protease family)